MMSVAESRAREDIDSEEEKSTTSPIKAFGLSTFKSTQAGLSMASKCFGKSVHNSNFAMVKNSTIRGVSEHVDAMPMPKKFVMAKKKKDREEKKQKLESEKAERAALEAAGVKLPKKKVASKFSYPTPEPVPEPKPLTVDEAMFYTTSWNAANVIAKKFAAGSLTTANYGEKTSVFSRMNEIAEERGSMYP